MSKENQIRLSNAIYDALEAMGEELTLIEIYGVLETVKMDIHMGITPFITLDGVISEPTLSSFIQDRYREKG